MLAQASPSELEASTEYMPYHGGRRKAGPSCWGKKWCEDFAARWLSAILLKSPHYLVCACIIMHRNAQAADLLFAYRLHGWLFLSFLRLTIKYDATVIEPIWSSWPPPRPTTTRIDFTIFGIEPGVEPQGTQVWKLAWILFIQPICFLFWTMCWSSCCQCLKGTPRESWYACKIRCMARRAGSKWTYYRYEHIRRRNIGSTRRTNPCAPSPLARSPRKSHWCQLHSGSSLDRLGAVKRFDKPTMHLPCPAKLGLCDCCCVLLGVYTYIYIYIYIL